MERMVTTMARAMKTTAWKTAEAPPIYRHAANQDVRVWPMACEDYFGRNPTQWEDEKERVIYALG